MLELRLEASILREILVFMKKMWEDGYYYEHYRWRTDRWRTELDERPVIRGCWWQTELFECSPTELYLQAMDPSKLCVVVLRLRPDTFKHYRCDRPISLGIVLPSLATILNFSTKDVDVVTIKADDGDGTDTVTFMFESETTFHYTMQLSTEEKESYLSIPEIQYEATVLIPSAKFVSIIKSLIGGYNEDEDTLTITVTNEGVKFCTSVREKVICHNVFCRKNNSIAVDDKPEGGEEEATLLTEMNEPVSVESYLSYLKPFTEARPLSNTIRINLSAGMPALFEYMIAETSCFQFYLVPTVEYSERLRKTESSDP